MKMSNPKYRIIVSDFEDGTVRDQLFTDEAPEDIAKALMEGSDFGIACWETLEDYQRESDDELETEPEDEEDDDEVIDSNFDEGEDGDDPR
jgi:hypothetical protein